MPEQQPRQPLENSISATTTEQLLTHAEQQLERLVQHYQQLEQQNQLLKKREAQWKSERARLLQTRNSVQAKVEAMISRLKDLEQD